MSSQRRLLVVTCIVLAACAHRYVAPPVPNDVAAVVVVPPKNTTGDPLLVAGTSFAERYAFRTPRVTVADVVAAEVEDFLRARGYRLPTSPVGSADAARLEVEIRRWEPDAGTHPEFVIVGMSATLVDAFGRVIWSTRPPVHPIATPGTVVLGDAYEIAARKAVAELLATWSPRG
jgi:hypothetical protein